MEESLTFVSKMKDFFQLKEVDIRTYSPLTLAYIGDSIYDLIIRTVIVSRGNTSVNKLHHHTIQYVKAPAQAKIAKALLPYLTEEEQDILRRGRNAKPYTKAKNATMEEYKKATSLEALVGYLYLIGREERLLELMKLGMEWIDAQEK